MALTKAKFGVISSALASGNATDGYVLTADGSGNSAWEEVAGGPTHKTFGTSSIMIGDNATGTIDAANNNTGVGVDVFAALTSGDDNVAIGKGAMTANTTGGSNVAVGSIALDANTTGVSNVAVGKGSLSTATTASSNTAMGANALNACTTGGTNTAIGSGAGESITTGQRNVFVGIEAGATMTTGQENCYVGRLAGKLATSGYSTGVGTEVLYNNTGNHNTSVGIQSMLTNTSGVNNTALGAYALKTNSTGSSNVAIGYKALEDFTGNNTVAVGYASLANATGADNTGLGHQTGENITSGAYNTCVGHNAGNTMTSPTYNTLVGYNAGQGSYPLTTGSSCTMVGALARPSGTLGNANGENVFGFNMSASGTNTTTLGSGGSGLYASHGSNSWTSISDERYKKDIVDSEVGLSFINDLRPRNFKWKTCGEVPSDTPRYEENSDELINLNLTGVMHGFIAQEVKAVIDNHSEVPNNQLIWKQDPDGIQGLAEGELVPVLVKAVQELSAKNDALEARIETLEGE